MCNIVTHVSGSQGKKVEYGCPRVFQWVYIIQWVIYIYCKGNAISYIKKVLKKLSFNKIIYEPRMCVLKCAVLLREDKTECNFKGNGRFLYPFPRKLLCPFWWKSIQY